MSTADRDTVDTVAKLLGERRKVSDWLTALDARRESTPPAVFEKVHDDYVAKLEKIQSKLVAASDAVQVAAADVASRLTEREAAVAQKRDERAEAELRFSVGEFSEKEWDKRRAKLDDDLAAMVAERDTLRDELRRLRDVLDEVAERATPAAASEMPEAVEALPSVEAYAEPVADAAPGEEPTPEPLVEMGGVEAEAVDADAVADETEPVSDAPLSPVTAPTIPIHEQSIIAPVEPAQPLAPSFDELAFLKSVVGRPTPAGTRHPAEPALVPKRSTSESKRATPAAPQAETGSPPPRPSVPTPEAPNPYALPEPPTPFPDPVPEPRVSQEMTPPRESFFGRPTPRTSEAVKSLRCQECGTLNYPTEWYCERCGGELAAF
ncbi:MAG: hypothetical protein H3C62_10010 [Gemmatimonadaceae bacterium]|nr:hypothetical protein [Gemmatimonadaceae bacterium]